ncbi:MAG: HEAT repeat domain-containing protein [Candidatus Brocadiae bacterium]|nr:HEAT repeat domain-containing protein [Candidatus Brocadiia bacterium]
MGDRIGVRPAALLLALCAAGVRADEFGDLERQAKDREYGAYWDRTKAFGKLAKIGTVKAAQAVLPHCGDEEAAVREFVALAIADFREAGAVAWLAANAGMLRTPEGRATAFWGFGLSRNEGYIPALEKAATADRDPVARAAAIRALGRIGSQVKDDILIAALKDSAWQPREEAAWAIRDRRVATASDGLVKLLSDAAWQPHAAALYALAACSPDRFREALPKAQKDKAWQVRLAACEAAVDVGNDEGHAAAVIGLDDDGWQARVAAIGVLERIWEERCVEPLVLRLEKEKGRLRYDIVLVLRAMSGREIGFDGKAWKSWWESAKADFKIQKKPKTRGGPAEGGGTVATFYNVPILSDRIGFTIDFSGSMFDEDENLKPKKQIDLAIDEYRKTVAALRPEVRFNLVVMSTEAIVQKVRAFAKKLVPADPRTRAAAGAWVEDARKKLEPIKRGRGDTWDAFVELLEDEEVDTVFILSDGRPSYGACVDEDHFLDELARLNRYRRVMIHTVLTGKNGTDRKFMEALASATGGQAVAR